MEFKVFRFELLQDFLLELSGLISYPLPANISFIWLQGYCKYSTAVFEEASDAANQFNEKMRNLWYFCQNVV